MANDLGYDYNDYVQMVADHYETDIETVLDLLNNYNFDPEKAAENLELLPDYYWVIYGGHYKSTNMISAKSTMPLTNESTALNSNLSSSKLVNIPINSSIDSSTGKVTYSKVSSALSKTANFVSGTVAPAVACVGIATTLAKVIDGALYNANPDFWDEHGMSGLDPDTWGDITNGDTSTQSQLFNMLLGIDDNSTQAYIDEKAFAYMAMYMNDKAVFETKYQVKKVPENFPNKQYIEQNMMPIYPTTLPITFLQGSSTAVMNKPASYTDCIFSYTNKEVRTIGISSSPTTASTEKSFTFNDKTVYYATSSTSYIGANISNPDKPASYTTKLDDYKPSLVYAAGVAWLALYNAEYVGVTGITTQDGGKVPSITGTTVDDVLAELKEQYPEIWANAVPYEVIQPDGTTKKYNYVPIALPNAISNSDTQPTTGSATQAKTAVDAQSDTATKNLVTDLIGSPPTTTNTTGSGATPSVVVPIETASSLYKIYNPTLDVLNSFGAWLWSENFIDQLLKLFNDPMQAIIGLHKVYSPVSVGGVQNIKVGYLDSGVASNWVSNRYETIDCGSVAVSERTLNVYDYEPFTNIYLYLPFIGIQSISVGEIMRSTVNIRYHVDVLSGACLAEIIVTRDGYSNVLYTFSGNCASQYPLSAGSYMGMVASIASLVGGGIATIASGGAALPFTVGGAMSALQSMKYNVSHSGNFSGNAGVMGIKKPYFIVTRQQIETASTFPQLNGYPTNYSTTVGNCSGFIKASAVRANNVPATKEEKQMIEQLITDGIVV